MTGETADRIEDSFKQDCFVLADLDLSANLIVLLEVDIIKLRREHRRIEIELIEKKRSGTDEDYLKHRGRGKALIINNSRVSIVTGQHRSTDVVSRTLREVLQEVELYLNLLIAAADGSIQKKLVEEVHHALSSVCSELCSSNESHRTSLLKSMIDVFMEKASWLLGDTRPHSTSCGLDDCDEIFRGTDRRDGLSPYDFWVFFVGMADDTYLKSIPADRYIDELGGTPRSILVASTGNPSSIGLRDGLVDRLQDTLECSIRGVFVQNLHEELCKLEKYNVVAFLFLEFPRSEVEAFLNEISGIQYSADVYAITPYSKLKPKEAVSIKSGVPTLFFIGERSEFRTKPKPSR